VQVLITGGAGYIGSHLANALHRAGHRVRVLDIRPGGDRLGAEQGGDYVQGSLSDAQRVARALQGVEVVYHLAWGFYPGDERRELQENVVGALNLVQAAQRGRVGQLIFASTAVVYGPTGPNPAHEAQPCHPERSTIGGTVYGIAKLACEKLCLAYAGQGTQATILRMHGVFGGGHLSQFGQMIEQALAGQAVRCFQDAGGEYARLGDVLRVFAWAMGAPQTWGQTYNLAGSHTYHDLELARYIVEAVGSESRIEAIDDPTQGMISVNTDKLCRALGSDPGSGEFLSGLIREHIRRARRGPERRPG
jgi:UDP-glucose 4-epimerase